MNHDPFSRMLAEIGHWTRSFWPISDVEAHYDALAADYDAINRRVDSYFRRFTGAMHLAELSDGAYMLDVCARTGQGTAYFYRQGKVSRAVCADVSRKMGALCLQRLQQLGLENYRWQQISSYEWPFADEEFEVVLSLETVEHFDNPRRFIQELGRVTRTGGTLVLSTPNVLWEPVHGLAAAASLHHSEGPHRFIPLRRLREYVSRAGFEIVSYQASVLVPAGPRWLLKTGRWLEAKIGERLLTTFGLRRLLICRKLL